MDGKNREIILTNYNYLISHIKLTQAFYEKCVETGLLLASKVTTIKKSTMTDEQKKCEVLNDVVTQKPDAFAKLKDVLRLSGHFLVVKELQRQEKMYTEDWKTVHGDFIHILRTRFMPQWEDTVAEYIQKNFVSTKHFPIAFQLATTHQDANANTTESLIQAQEREISRMKKECARLRNENTELHRQITKSGGLQKSQAIYFKP